LKRHGFDELVSLLFFQADDIKNHFKDGRRFGVKMDYLQPAEDYGTAGAVRFAEEFINETTLVISGDVLTDFNLSEAMEWHHNKKSDATILLTRVENPLAYGIVITDENGRITRFLEKPSWGELFSDTINTGIYILEPHTVRLIPPKTNFDFSQNLFPLMLSREMNLNGIIAEGYWKDVGNIEEYFLAHHDFLAGKIDLSLDMERKKIGEADLYLGKRVKLGDDLKIEGVVIIGDDTSIADSVTLNNSIIDKNCSIGSQSEINNSVIWPDVIIGGGSRLNRSVIGHRSQIGDNVVLIDHVIVSDDCTIGSGATVKANCKIWAGKSVDDGAILSTSLVWGEKWNRELITESKVTGLALTELTPEMCVKLGAAFGAFVGPGKSVVTSRDNPNDYHLIDIIFFDGNGIDMPTSKLKKVERLFFGEDFRRANLDETGHLEMPQGILENYRADFIAAVNADLIRKSGFKVVIDYSNGGACQVFPTIFTQLGIDVVALNAHLDPRKFSRRPDEMQRTINQLSAIVESLDANIGFIINSAAEKLTVVDDKGKLIDNQLLLMIMTDLFLRTHPAHRIAVPVGATMGIEEIASKYGVEVLRVRNSHLAMMEAFQRGGIDYVGGTRGGFIFPTFQLGTDAVLAAVYILEMLAKQKVGLAGLRGEFEKYLRAEISVPCPWAKKGQVMRKLISYTNDKNRQLIDGVRVMENGGSVLVAPDNLAAAFNIFAEAKSQDSVDNMISQYRTLIEEAQE